MIEQLTENWFVLVAAVFIALFVQFIVYLMNDSLSAKNKRRIEDHAGKITAIAGRVEEIEKNYSVVKYNLDQLMKDDKRL